jgi:hypothetical protein
MPKPAMFICTRSPTSLPGLLRHEVLESATTSSNLIFGVCGFSSARLRSTCRRLLSYTAGFLEYSGFSVGWADARSRH